MLAPTIAGWGSRNSFAPEQPIILAWAADTRCAVDNPARPQLRSFRHIRSEAFNEKPGWIEIAVQFNWRPD